jgi:hypothetical protein
MQFLQGNKPGAAQGHAGTMPFEPNFCMTPELQAYQALAAHVQMPAQTGMQHAPHLQLLQVQLPVQTVSNIGKTSSAGCVAPLATCIHVLGDEPIFVQLKFVVVQPEQKTIKFDQVTIKLIKNKCNFSVFAFK